LLQAAAYRLYLHEPIAKQLKPKERKLADLSTDETLGYLL
jgi:hypothetical protein